MPVAKVVRACGVGGKKVSCNVDSHETVMSPASCAALYNYNVLSSCADVCMKRGAALLTTAR